MSADDTNFINNYSLKESTNQQLSNENLSQNLSDSILKMDVPDIRNSPQYKNIGQKNVIQDNYASYISSLPGLSYSNSASKRKEVLRNQEYNEFKRKEEESFRNRFSDKKTRFGRVVFVRERNSANNLSDARNPITSEYIPTYLDRLSPAAKSVSLPIDYAISTNDNIYGNNSFIVIDNNNNATDRPFLRTKSNLRSLEQTEKQLADIEREYESSKIRIMKTHRPNVMKKMDSILDDESILESEIFTKQPFKNDKTTKEQISIFPFGNHDEESLKRQRQAQYRHDLENQMKEKLQNSKSNKLNSNENISFFDRFGSNNVKRTNKLRPNESKVEGQDQNDDYYYYANRNPLDDTENNSYIPSAYNIGNTPKVYNAQSLNKNPDMKTRFSNSLQNESYGEALKRQIAEKRLQKEIDKQNYEEYERRKNNEISNYNPFGRGGGGAPLKDSQGETVADLRNFKYDNNITIPPSSYRSKIDSYRIPEKTFVQSGLSEEKTFARGGHGIFGQALSEEEKSKAERYKDELKIQMENKRRQKEIERENERIREQKELEKIERERKQMQLELENEKLKLQEKEKEKMRQLTESKPKEKKIEEKTSYVPEEPKELFHNSYKPRESPIRKFSPLPRYSPVRFSPIPRYSPILKQKPLPSPRLLRESTPLDIQRNNNELVDKLNALKNHLLSQTEQLEKDIFRQKRNVDIFDPRLVKNQQSNYDSDIFKNVIENLRPISGRQGYLKSKENEQNINTEAYLDQHLKQQERALGRLNQNVFNSFELNKERMNPRYYSTRPQSDMSNLLESETDYVPFNLKSDSPLKGNDSHFPKMSKPYNSNSEFGSNTSLNIDALKRKNQQRLRTLQASKNNNDTYETPEEILNKLTSVDNDKSYLFTAY